MKEERQCQLGVTKDCMLIILSCLISRATFTIEENVGELASSEALAAQSSILLHESTV
jgi:hypothetical protein